MFRRPEMEGVEGTDENPVVSMYSTSVRSNYLTFPLDVKYSAFRVNNYRPYLIGGIYGAFDLGRKKRKSDPVERNGFRCRVWYRM